MKKKKNICANLLFAVIALISFFELFYSADRFVMDKLYQTPSKTNVNIRIITIDEKTLDAYGPLHTWSRDKMAELMELFQTQKDSMPAVIGLDILFSGEGDTAVDDRLAKACSGLDSIVVAANIVNQTVLEVNEAGQLQENKLHISMVEKPYNALLSEVEIGFANIIQDQDGYIRRSTTHREYEGERIDSLAMSLYRHYCAVQNIAVTMPKVDSLSRFSFTYSGKPGAYETVSLVDVLEGMVDCKTFKDCVVLVGAYAPGSQEAFNTPIHRAGQMYGVEINANILEALMEGKTVSPMNPYLAAFIFAIVGVLFYFSLAKAKVVGGAVILMGIIGLQLTASFVCYQNGIEMPLITLPIFLTMLYFFQLVKHYLAERNKRKQVLNAFQKYVAPQVVEELSKSGEFQLVLGGECRQIACLFVDIRGFTPLSESLDPQQIVAILNAYLSLTTQAVFHHKGTLDKFIGDATMAVFNAPFDLNDYVYKAVCVAVEINAGAEALEQKLMEQFGKSVGFGIGIHCGPAVVGNIGCDFRMDYTAIGDTVNTAARLESNAKRGQILISEAVYEAVKGRITVEEVGVIPLKGKSNGMMVYSVLDEVMESKGLEECSKFISSPQ